MIAALTVARELALVGVVAPGAANAVAPVAAAVAAASPGVPPTAAVGGLGPLPREANGALRVATVPSAVTGVTAPSVATAAGIVAAAVPWVKAALLPVASPSLAAPRAAHAALSRVAVRMVPASVPAAPSDVPVVRLAALTTAVLLAVVVVRVVRSGVPAPRGVASQPPARMADPSVLGVPRGAPRSALAPPLPSAARLATATASG